MSTNMNATGDADFYPLATIPDYNAHNQAAQRNYTVSITVPNEQCSHCVIRMRYVPHKPTENIFYQCTDVSVSASTAFTPDIYGVMYDDAQGGPSQLVGINGQTGAISILASLEFDIKRAESNGPYITDQVCARNLINNTVFYTASTNTIGSLPNILVSVNTETLEVNYLDLNIDQALVAIVYDQQTETIWGLQLVPWPQRPQDFFQYTLVNLDLKTGNVVQKLQLPKDDTYVNYQWCSFDHTNRILYLLSGNENDPFGLSTLLFAINVDALTYTTVQPDNSHWTIAGIHYDPILNQLYAVSPGLFSNTSYTMVSVNPLSGAVTPEFTVAKPEVFISYYGGDIFGFDEVSRTVQYALFVNENDGVIANVNVDHGTVNFSPVIQNLSQIHNLANVMTDDH